MNKVQTIYEWYTNMKYGPTYTHTNCMGAGDHLEMGFNQICLEKFSTTDSRAEYSILTSNGRPDENGFIPGGSTTDRILAVNVIAQIHCELQKPL